MVTTKLNLSMTEPQVRQIYAKQGDTGRVLDISLDQTPEDGTLRILRPDGVEVTSEAVTGGEVESGSTFESLTEADVTELTVGIEPVQDLNGYDKPWPAGGGKNKLKITATTTTINGITYTVNGDGTIVANGTASGTSTIVLTSGTGLFNFDSEMILNGSVSGFGDNIRIRLGLTNPGIVYDDFGNGVTIPQISDISTRYAYVQLTIFSGTTVSNIVFKPMIRLATETDATFAPYSNICPITGHDEVRVTRTGKNLLDVSLGQYKSLNSTTGELGADNPLRFTSALTDLPDGTYTFSFGSNMFIIGIAFYDKSGSFKRYDAKNFSTTAQTFSVEREKIRLYCGSAQNHDDLVNGLSVGQLELGSTATAYEPYRSNTYTTSLGQTVYGGTLDMVSGALTVDRAMVDLGTLTWGYDSGNNRFTSLGIADLISGGETRRVAMLCSAFRVLQNGEAFDSNLDGVIYTGGANKTILVQDHRYTVASDFKTAMNGVQVVYPLATPQTYQLTPQQIKTLVGTNNVWASSGDIVNIKFTYGGLLSELPSDATSVVGKCYCDVEQNGVSSMPFTLNIKKNERQ